MTVFALAARNMDTARRLTGDLLIKNPVKEDLSRDYVAVQGWPLIVALYTGIEQALKMLLLVPLDPPFSPETLKSPKFGHNLKKLYSKLGAADRDHIERHFAEHRSLHDYDTPGYDLETAERFIAHINGTKKLRPDDKKQLGSISWRYILLDGIAEVPPTSLWTMYEIWDAICCRIRKEVFNKRDDCSSLSRRLMWGFNRRFPTLVPYEAFNGDMRSWMFHKEGSPLAAWIDLLTKAHGDAIHEVQAPDELRPVLADASDRALKKMASDSADPDESMLLHRIQADSNLVWAPGSGIFR